MTSANLRTINFTEEEKPYLPIASSHQAGWDQMQFALYHQPPYCIPEHYSPHHVICINTGNPVTLQQRVNGQSETIDSVPGDIGIYPANLWQTFHWYQEAAFLQLYLEPTLITQVAAELGGKDDIELVPQLKSCFDPLIYQIAIALKTVLETDGTGSKLYADTMANALAVHLLSWYSTRKPVIQQCSGGLSQQQLKQIITYINEYLERDLSLTELAKGGSTESLSFRPFVQTIYRNFPHQYHIRCRVDRAKQLLLARDLTIADIAHAIGFASQGHLNYHFKRFVGITPKAFLRR